MSSTDIRKLINLIEARSGKVSVQKLHQAMSQIADFSNSNIDYGINEAYEICMKYLPDARYTGVMFRGLSIRPDVIANSNLNSLTASVQQKMQAYARQVTSWTPDIETTFRFINGTGVVLEQQATGLDVNNLYHEETDFSVQSAFDDENEVLAYTTDSVSIAGFVAVDQDENPVFFPVAKFNDFVKSIQS